MSGTQQVDSQTLRDTGTSFLNSAGTVDEIVAAIAGSVGALIWTGGIAEQFIDDFNVTYQPMLTQLMQDMEATSTALNDKAAEYDLVFHGAA